MRAQDQLSFRDPAGYMFRENNQVYRRIHNSYKEHYQHLINSGLYQHLTQAGYLLPHAETEKTAGPECFKIIQPVQLPFLSYPYEWCFGQLKDAALLTLRIQSLALKHGMVLKDASAFNIQLFDGRPVFIDTLSFERYQEKVPWAAYYQFCRHFLAPLMVMDCRKFGLTEALSVYPQGLPLSLASSLLPWNTWMDPAALIHIHFQARAEKKMTNKDERDKKNTLFSPAYLSRLAESLEAVISRLSFKPPGRGWNKYYAENSSPAYTGEKTDIVYSIVNRENPAVLLDIGSNTGALSRKCYNGIRKIIALDMAPECVEENYALVKRNREKNTFPLLMDICNPSSSSGWAASERLSFSDRCGRADMALLMSMVHHLVIVQNIPFERIAEYMKSLCRKLIVEFIPSDDVQVASMLKRKASTLPYSLEIFETSFSAHFNIQSVFRLSSSKRIIYLMKAYES